MYLSTEDQWIDKTNAKNNGYNIADAAGGDMISSHPNAVAIRKQIATTLRNNYAALSPEERSSKFGRSGVDNHGFGKHRSPETKAKMSESKSGKNHPYFGKKLPSEWVTRIAKGNTGKRRSAETKALLSSQKIGGLNPQAKSVFIDGVMYCTVTEASQKLKLDRRTIQRRVQSSKYPNYM